MRARKRISLAVCVHTKLILRSANGFTTVKCENCQHALPAPFPLQQNVAPLSSVVRGDFTNMPFDSNSFDGAYAIEATCHAPKVSTCHSTHSYAHAHTHTQAHTHTHTYIHIHTHTQTRTDTHIHTHTHTDADTHRHRHTHTRTQVHTNLNSHAKLSN
jgi:hypothetical protein